MLTNIKVVCTEGHVILFKASQIKIEDEYVSFYAGYWFSITNVESISILPETPIVEKEISGDFIR